VIPAERMFLMAALIDLEPTVISVEYNSTLGTRSPCPMKHRSTVAVDVDRQDAQTGKAISDEVQTIERQEGLDKFEPRRPETSGVIYLPFAAIDQ
jgi:hypothetical protein